MGFSGSALSDPGGDPRSPQWAARTTKKANRTGIGARMTITLGSFLQFRDPSFVNLPPYVDNLLRKELSCGNAGGKRGYPDLVGAYAFATQIRLYGAWFAEPELLG